jgi:hypothetical protein
MTQEGIQMQRTTRSIVSTLATTFLCLGAAAAPEQPPARYQVVFERTWSEATHPQDFPLLAHFSPVIGLTHAAGAPLFPMGKTASAGLERLCEEGKHQPLDGEIRSAIQNGSAGALIETMEPIRSVPGKATTSFEIDATHSMVSIAAMIAPSPDWCAVAANVQLMENGQWVAEKKVALEAWDMGTDSATSYRALDADMQPRGPVQPIETAYFAMSGKRVPVGSVTFVRQ